MANSAIGTVQVTKGVRVFTSTTVPGLLDPLTRKVIPEVQATPDKGSDVETVDAPNISLLRGRSVSGVMGAPDSISYTVNADWTAITGSFDIALALLGKEVWVAEEMKQAKSDTDISEVCILQRMKIETVSPIGQGLNSLQTFTISATDIGQSLYLARYSNGMTPTGTYTDIMTGKTVAEEDVK